VSFGVVPLSPADDDSLDVEAGDRLKVEKLHEQLRSGEMRIENVTKGTSVAARHELSNRKLDVLLASGLVNWARQERKLGG
jgi:aconitate hydratase